MNKSTICTTVGIYLLSATACYANDTSNDTANSDDDDYLLSLSLEQLLDIEVVTGTRAKSRKLSDATVAIDAYDAESLKLNGSVDLTIALRNLIPSYNALAKSTDGNAFIGATTLRGLPPDNTLLLLNSKRRHRSALIQHGGPPTTAGAHASDPSPIPTIALKSVELLRDGAASQYGSDAIAGVLNFILKDSDEGGQLQAQWGQYNAGERALTLAGNIGLSLFEQGFINLSAEYTNKEQLIRGTQPTTAQAQIDAGNQHIGLDSPYAGDNLAQTWGRPETHGLRTAFNAEYMIDDNKTVYGFGNYADTYNNYRFFYRPIDHASLQAIPLQPDNPAGGNFCWCDTLLGGYTPYLEGDIIDFSTTFGLRGEFDNAIAYDLSSSLGINKIDYQLNNSLNPSFGPDSPRDFDVGDLAQKELNINADFSKPFDEKLHVAWGFEWREETYVIEEAQFESWALGPWAYVAQLINPASGESYTPPPIGSNGMSGSTPNSAGRFSRDNVAIYTDIEWAASETVLLQGALRFERFSDFGNTVNAKLAIRYKLSDKTTLRGAISNGFRAPTPGQSNYTGIQTTTNSISGQLTEEGTISPTSALALSLGGKALDAEKSKNLSVGLTSALQENFSITIDAYWIELKDRIAKSINIVVDDPLFTRASFYTNALTSETKGVDITLKYNRNWENGTNTRVNFAYNHNQNQITGQNQVNSTNPVSDTQIFNIENTLPENRFNLTVTHHINPQWHLKLRANYFGKSQDDREQETLSARTYTDLEIGYHSSKTSQIILGASNLFNTYPNKIQTHQANGLPYARRSALDYDGGMVYLKFIYGL
ncbi:MAG: iron complex outermembrane receptor protein [Phenylobacterium sp.]|jgi:iron complex outermembrane receptor protein